MTGMTAERRQAARRRTLIGATIRVSQCNATFSCTVRNLSEGGARLDIENPMWLPDAFELDIPHHDLRAPARIVRRADNHVAVAFGNRREAKSISEVEKIRVLEAERAKLAERVRRLSEAY
ncbi:MAG: PilZ domain-containing protein [Proteobacteria bacterium]|nr:PilZ domain-containing protein [Pseudomonadota bacterium]